MTKLIDFKSEAKIAKIKKDGDNIIASGEKMDDENYTEYELIDVLVDLYNCEQKYNIKNINYFGIRKVIMSLIK